MTDDLKLIKKYYGEDTMHYARDNFATILEEPGKLISILERTFAHDKYLMDGLYLYEDEDEFKDLIYKLYEFKKGELTDINKTPFELMDEAGYTLYECKTEEEIQSFKKYYAKKEELCTFKGGRLDTCYVFFAVKKDVDKIIRKDFKNPQREDEYGTSVISIQFYRTNYYLSIKNRYNHTVRNPDATFGNNLENIIPGLTNAFQNYYHFKIFQNVNNCFTNFMLGDDNRYYRYNYEINNITYCANNYIIDNGNIISDYTDKSRYLIIDYFIIDLKEKKTFTYKNVLQEDSFISLIKSFEKIEIKNDKEKKMKIVDIYTIDDHISINIDNVHHNIVNITCYETMCIGSGFLKRCDSIETINMPKVQVIGNLFLYCANKIKEINLPNVIKIGNDFMNCRTCLKDISFPKLMEVGDSFFSIPSNITKVNLPKLKKVGKCFFSQNRVLESINMPELEVVDDCFLYENNSLKEISFPKLKIIGCDFLVNNNKIRKVFLPNVEEVGSNFLAICNQIHEIDFPNLREVGNYFFESVIFVSKFNLPNLETIGTCFLEHVMTIEQKTLYLPSLKSVGDFFLYRLKNKIIEIDMPSVVSIGDSALLNLRTVKKVNLPKVIYLGNDFLYMNKSVVEINLASLTELNEFTFYENRCATKVNIPNLANMDITSFASNNNIHDELLKKCCQNKQLVKKRDDLNG